MELSQFTDYSLRTLIYVGLHQGELCCISDISGAFNVSRNHVVKVVQNLGRLGYLENRRGRRGGVRLKRPPEEIVVGEVIRRTESLGLVECMPPRSGTCCIAGVCELQTALRRATQAFLAELDNYTVADLTRRKTALKRLLTPGHKPEALTKT